MSRAAAGRNSRAKGTRSAGMWRLKGETSETAAHRFDWLDLGVWGVLLAVFAYAAVASLWQRAPAKYSALVVGLLGVVTCGWQIVGAILSHRAARSEASGDAESPAVDRGTTRTDEERQVDGIGGSQGASSVWQRVRVSGGLWIAVLFSSFWLFGLMVTTLLFPTLYLKVRARVSWPKTIVFAVFMFVFIYGFFARVLDLPIYRGRLMPWVGR
jgi:hypothetical protein